MQPNESDEIVNEPRGNPAAEKPYCWQSKKALRTICVSYGDDTRRLPYLMSTYLALTEIASDEGRPVFTKTVSEILSKAGGSDRKMRESLGLLERLGLLHARHNFVHRDAQKGKAPNTYTLLTLRHGVPNPYAQCAEPSGTEEIRSVPILIKNADAKNLKKKETHPSDVTHQSDDWRSCFSEWELSVIDQYNSICVPRGWRPVNADSEELHTALDTFQDHTIDWFKKAFSEADEDRELAASKAGISYNSPRGNKLLRILWANY
jgi:hypothetical protein